MNGKIYIYHLFVFQLDSYWDEFIIKAYFSTIMNFLNPKYDFAHTHARTHTLTQNTLGFKINFLYKLKD